MGNLKPGATYIYERQGGTVYAREFGADPSTRQAIGWDYEPENNPSRVRGMNRSEGQKELDDHNLWIKIRLEGKKNPSLQKAIDRVKILYHLSKQDGTK
jgi:hypothetical protein